MVCAICGCKITEPYRNPLGSENKITCWYHSDYYFVVHPNRLEAAKKKHKDIPNFYNEGLSF